MLVSLVQVKDPLSQEYTFKPVTKLKLKVSMESFHQIRLSKKYFIEFNVIPHQISSFNSYSSFNWALPDRDSCEFHQTPVAYVAWKKKR